jgi:hypothetical protein
LLPDAGRDSAEQIEGGSMITSTDPSTDLDSSTDVIAIHQTGVSLRSRRAGSAALCVLLLLTTAASQKPARRDLRTARVTYGIEDENGLSLEFAHLFTNATVDPPPVTLKWHLSPTGTIATLELPGLRPGDLTRVGTRRFVLVGGTAVGDGIITVLELRHSGPEIAVLGSVAAPGTDLTHVTYNDRELRLYVYDFAGHELRSAPWDPDQPLPVWSQFELVADASTLNYGDEALFQILGPAIDQSIGATFCYQGTWSRRWIRKENGVWVQSFLGWADTDPQAFGWAVGDALFASVDQLRVFGAAPAAIELVDAETGAVVGMFDYLVGRTWQTLDTSVLGLVPGRGYRIRGGEQTESALILPLFRRGTTTEAGTLRIGRGILAPDRAQVGAVEFGPGCSLQLLTPPTAPSVVQGGLWLAVHFDGPLPIVDVDGNGTSVALLQPDGAVALSVPFDTDRTEGGLGYPVAIPGEDALVGALLLFQFVALSPDGQVVVSDVFGTRIRPEPGDAAQRAAGGSVDESARLAAARSELLGERFRLTDDKRRRVGDLQRRLREQLRSDRR